MPIKKGTIARPLQDRPHYKVAARIGWKPRKLGLWLRDHGFKTKVITEGQIEAALRAKGVQTKGAKKKDRATRVEFKEVVPPAPAHTVRALDHALRNLHDAEGHLQAYYGCLAAAKAVIAGE
jgi:hypothetical protein